MYKAEDLHYDLYDNSSWDVDEKENAKWSTPPLKRHGSRSYADSSSESPSQRRSGGGGSTTSQSQRSLSQRGSSRQPRFVAIKKIYVTSSPVRILNELDLLHDLRSSPSVCPLITALRHGDQVLAVLPYFRHADFLTYFRRMTLVDTAIYMRSLFLALRDVHAHSILHRDIKPTNFLYDPRTRRGVLVDFGLAERESYDGKPCLCHEDPAVRKQRVQESVAALAGPQLGFPRVDTRPSRRANRAGTRGFRAPEVLFKCTEQTTKIDVWSAGVVLLIILSRRFPFFNSADDIEAMIEIATIFGSKRMEQAGLLHGCMFQTNIPTVTKRGFTLERIILWSTCRQPGPSQGGVEPPPGQPLNKHERLAVQFLERCLELDPSKRISAEEALQHDFLNLDMNMDDEMDLVGN